MVKTERVVHEFDKNSRERIRISVRQFRGRRLVDIRVFVRKGGEWHPSKRGVAFAPDHLSELEIAVKNLRMTLSRVGRARNRTSESVEKEVNNDVARWEP